MSNDANTPATQQHAPFTGHAASSDASTVNNGTTPTDQPEQPLTAMNLAFQELQRTIHEAAALRGQSGIRPRLLRSHIDALKEDITLLSSIDTPDDTQRTRATELVLQARRLRRLLERDLIDAETSTEDAANQHVLQLVPLDNRKQPQLQLMPVKAPTFDGDISQFRVFRDFYEENVLHNDQLTDTTKWLRLTESLSHRPAELISELPKTSHTLTIAWKLLLDMYGGDDRPVVELYERLQRLPPASLSTPSLRMTHSKLEGVLLSLEHLGHDINTNGYIRWVYVSKFPVDISYQIQKNRTATLAEIRVAINELLLARECVDHTVGVADRAVAPSTSAVRAPAQPSSSRGRPNVPSGPAGTSRPLRCVFCAGEHWNDVCTVYPSLESRRERLSGKCFICLRRQHPDAPCTTQRRCFHCDSFSHNRALCPTKFQEPVKQPTVHAATLPESSINPSGHFLTFVAPASSNAVRKPIDIRVVLDTAGGSTVLRKDTAQQLQLPCTRQRSTNSGLGGADLAPSYKLLQPLHLQPPSGPAIQIHADMVDSIIPEVPTPDVPHFRRLHPQYDALHIPPTGKGKPIDLLIGSDTLVDLLLPERILAVDKNTLLLPTKFGSLILGRDYGPQHKVCHSHLFNTSNHPLYQMCNLDLVGLTGLHNTEIEEEQRAIQQFYDTVQFVEGRYSISWPWRSHPPNLDTNFGLALGRLRSLYKKLQTNPQLLHEYNDIIQQQLRNEVIELVTPRTDHHNLIHYLPHHPILRPGKSTSLRPVYDGSSKSTRTGNSLNDNILKGTNWLNDLVQTLLRFRKYKNVAVADIAKAFHQIAINDTDRDVTRFLWLKDLTQPPEPDNLQIYRFKRVAFGIVASPFILSATIKHHANQHSPNELITKLITNLYADNLLIALDDHIDPIQFYSCAKTFFSSMGMNLTKWTSNNEHLLRHIHPSDQLSDEIPFALGLQWDKKPDNFSIASPKLAHDQIATRRTVARTTASYFDPLGWATPILLLAKAFFRKIWNQTDRWDEPLSHANALEWNDITKKLEEINKIQLPRHIGLSGNQQTIRLHAFVDASAVAYAVVVYIQLSTPAGSQLALISSKNRLTPTKHMTIPKLELIAILLGSRYIAFLKSTLHLPDDTTTIVWSDSKCALSWTRHNKILPTIIEKHVTEIKSYKISQFRYVPSERNFADVATRGAEYAVLLQMGWWNGPNWLHVENDWPIDECHAIPENNSTLIFQTKLMLKTKQIAENEIDGIATLRIRDFSSLSALFIRTAYILQAVNKLLKRHFIHLQSHIDIKTSEKLWLKWDQNRIYAVENEPEPGKPFLLRNINVFRDSDGLIRCNTRITNSTMDLDTVSPILLVQNSTLTQLIILQMHQLHKHAGTNHTLANIRRKYWLPQGRKQVYKVILHKCYKCRRQTSQSYPNPPPAPLPEFRVVRSQKPFQATGVDIFGPFLVRHMETYGYIKQKRWVLIFTCATVRAIHLEIIHEMTTEEISHSFRRFIARRGVPNKIISDNAPQFHSLDGYFASIWHTVAKSPTLSNYFALHQITWEFTTELAPWMGGIYERLIQSIKVAFEKTYGSKTLTSRQFETAILEIEAVLNARPIGYVDRHPDTPILTPNDFLMANFNAIPIKNDQHTTDDTITKLWRSSQAYLDEFWRYWSDQYILLLRDRNDQLPNQRRTTKYQPHPGDIIVMQDLSRKRSAWQMAVVERLIPGKDNEIRSVQIRIPNGSRLIRPVIALAPLQLRMDLPTIRDSQLNKRRDALIVWPREGASQLEQNSNEEQQNTSEERELERNSEQQDM